MKIDMTLPTPERVLVGDVCRGPFGEPQGKET